MLDEPPLIVRMRGLAGFMDDSFVIMAGMSLWLEMATLTPATLYWVPKGREEPARTSALSEISEM